MAFDKGSSQTLPQGTQPYVVSPSGASGNYFERLDQQRHRWQTNGNLFLPSRQWHGAHNLSLGFNADSAAFTQQASRNAIESEDPAGVLRLMTAFSGLDQFHLSNTQAGGYVQDSWCPMRPFVLQTGARVDWNGVIGRTLPAPRFAANYIPFADDRAKLTMAWGVYYQPVDLSLLGLGYDQSRVDLVNPANGGMGGGTPALEGPFVSRFVVPGSLRQPRFRTASAGWEQRIGSSTFVTVRAILRRERSGLAYQFLPSRSGFGGEFLLQNNQRDEYRSIEVSLRRSFRKAEVFADYIRSRARSNQALDYTLGNPLFAPQLPGALPWDAPNRFLSYGWMPAPIWNLLLSYHFECRTGFPFGLLSSYQQLVSSPDRLRFPTYLNLDMGIEKRFHFHGHEWAARLLVVNMTGHQNPDTVTNIAGRPIVFAGGQGRAFTARLRLVGRK